MRLQENIDFTTLTWVKPELDETLKQARNALQIFVEPSLFYSITKAGSSWWSLNQLGYSFAFAQGDFGMSATVSIVLLVISILAAMILVFRTNFFQTEVDD